MRNCCGYRRRFSPGVRIGLPVVGAIYFLIALFTPRLHDDLNFLEMFRRANGGDVALNVNSWLRYLELIRLENDGRFSNCLEIFFLKLPPAVFGAVMAVAAMVWLGGSALIASRGERVNLLRLGVLWVLVILFLPWNDDILGCMNFELNYVVSSGVETLFLLLLIRAGERTKGCLAVISVVTAFVAGGFHEGFSLPIVSGYVVWTLLKRRKPAMLEVAMLVAACVGICMDIFTEGLLTRIDGARSASGLQLRLLFRYLTLPGLIVSATIVALCFRSGREWLRNRWQQPRISLIAAIAACGLGMAVVLGGDGRISWAADWFAAVLATALLPNVVRLNRRVVGGIWLAIIVFYANVIYHQHRYYREAAEVMRLYEVSADGRVDYLWEPAAPLTTLHHVCRWNLYAPGPLRFIENIDSLHRPLRVRRPEDE